MAFFFFTGKYGLMATSKRNVAVKICSNAGWQWRHAFSIRRNAFSFS